MKGSALSAVLCPLRACAHAQPGMSGHDMHGMEGQRTDHGWLAIIDVASGKTISTLMLGPSPTGVGAAGAR